jgi:hypothetical protein
VISETVWLAKSEVFTVRPFRKSLPVLELEHSQQSKQHEQRFWGREELGEVEGLGKIRMTGAQWPGGR